jgi:Ring finger domain
MGSSASITASHSPYVAVCSRCGSTLIAGECPQCSENSQLHVSSQLRVYDEQSGGSFGLSPTLIRDLVGPGGDDSDSDSDTDDSSTQFVSAFDTQSASDDNAFGSTDAVIEGSQQWLSSRPSDTLTDASGMLQLLQERVREEIMLMHSLQNSEAGLNMPAAKSAVAALQRKRRANAVQLVDQPHCSVCMEDFLAAEVDCEEQAVDVAADDDLLEMPCGHIFHAATCLEPWLKKRTTCPACRYALPTAAEANYKMDYGRELSEVQHTC